MADLYLVRHGETEINAEERFNGGGVDSPLTAQGIAGAEAARQLLAPVKFARVYSSPLPRAMTTAEIVAGANTPITIDPRLREMGLGDWDGTKLADAKDDPQFYLYRHRMLEWDYRRYHAEGYQHMADRAQQALVDAAHWLGDRRGLVVSHGIVLTIMANYLSGVPLNHARDSGQVANSSVTVLHGDGSHWEILAWNVTADTLGDLTPAQQQLFK